MARFPRSSARDAWAHKASGFALQTLVGGIRQTGDMRTLEEDRLLAQECVGMLDRRWAHVRGVGRTAEQLAALSHLVTEVVVRAAWLHDVGYGPDIQSSGFHALDGARYLAKLGVDPGVVSLVAFHTGATYEAKERQLSAELAEFEEPDPSDLDLLTLIDLGTSPDGAPIVDSVRLDEVLRRYQSNDPVARAVGRSKPSLLAASRRAKERLGLPDDWPVCSR